MNAPKPTTKRRQWTKAELERAKLKRRVELADEAARVAAEKAAHEKEAQLVAEQERRRRDAKTTAEKRLAGLVASGHMTMADATRASNRIAHKFAKDPAADIYGLIDAAASQAGGHLPRPRESTLADHGPVMPDGLTKEQIREWQKQHGERLARQRQKDREAYEAALRRHGLTNPTVGAAGRNPGGLGY